MALYWKIKGDTFIDKIPVYGNGEKPGNIVAVDINPEWLQPGHRVDVSFEFPASGEPGYNMEFSTVQSLEKVLEGFQKLMDPSSPIYGNAYGIILGMFEHRLAELNELLQQSHEDEKVNLSTIPGDDTTKIKYFWYNSRKIVPGFPEKPRFAFNISRYDEEVFDAAYALTDFPITRTDREELRTLFLRFERFGHQ